MKYFVVIPAAGISTRMGTDTPKQYLKILSKTVLEHSLDKFINDVRFEKVILVLNQNDLYWSNLQITHEKILTVVGGAERTHSVLNGLEVLMEIAADDDWVLVHDAARPCLKKNDLDQIIKQLHTHPVGGLLGTPVRDTLKMVNSKKEAIATIDRSVLWQAFTPQMFRFKKLHIALQTAINNRQTITDEASAMELIGEKPVMINGDPTNIKITYYSDLLIAKNYL